MTSMMTVWAPACALVGFLSVAGATQTRAAYWNYACKGAVGEAELLFDRNYLVVMPKKLAQGEVLGIRDGSIGTFESADGLQKVLDMGIVEGATSAINQIDELIA